MGRYTEARRLLAPALAIREKAMGPEQPLVAPTLSWLAIAYPRDGRVNPSLYAEAELLSSGHRHLAAALRSAERTLDGVALQQHGPVANLEGGRSGAALNAALTEYARLLLRQGG